MPEESNDTTFGEATLEDFRPELAGFYDGVQSDGKKVEGASPRVEENFVFGEAKTELALKAEVGRLAAQCVQKDNRIHQLESQLEDEQRQRVKVEEQLRTTVAMMTQAFMSPHDIGRPSLDYMQAMNMMGFQQQLYGGNMEVMPGLHRNPDMGSDVMDSARRDSSESDADTSSSSMGSSNTSSWGQAASIPGSWTSKDDPRMNGRAGSPRSGGRRSASPGNASPAPNWDSAKNAEWPLPGTRTVNWVKNGKGEDNSNMVKLWTKRPNTPGGLTETKWASEGSDTEVALLDAAQHNNVELIGKLVAEGASVECRGVRSNKTALMTAAHVGNVKAVRALLDLKADPNVIESFDAWTALHFATRNGHPRTLQALLDNPRTNPDATAHKGWTALHFAAYYGKSECARVLLSHPSNPANNTLKTDINCPRYPGLTAFEIDAAQSVTVYQRGVNGKRSPQPFI